MKLPNLFKKETKKEAKTTFQKLDKKQLTKVVGGAEKDKPTVSTGGSTVGGLMPGGSILSAG